MNEKCSKSVDRREVGRGGCLYACVVGVGGRVKRKFGT